MNAAGASIIQYLESIYDDFRQLEAKSLTTTRHNLSIGEWHIIDRIGPEKLMRIGDLAGASSVTMASMTVAVKKLEKKGFLYKKQATEDRRGVFVGLTRRGKAAFCVHRKFHQHMLEAMLEGLNDSQVSALLSAFATLQRFVTDNI